MKMNGIQAALKDNFKKFVLKDKNIHNAYLMVHSERSGIHLNMAEGATDNMPAHPEQPYFIASVGKLFTSVLVGILTERGMLSYGDSIIDHLEPGLLKGLHVYKGKDYTAEIKVKHLLNHTSGLQDYFEDKPEFGKTMIDHLLDEPSRFWTPQETILWSKRHLKSHFPPGEGFHYSDTNYHLLGLIIEKVTSKPYKDVLKHYFFEPLGMKHSYLLQYSQPIEKSPYPIADFYIRKIPATHYRSLSIDYAGGGIVSTSNDLLKFMKALVRNELIHQDTMKKMKDWAKYSIGIDYGYGLMNFKTIPLLMPRKYNVWGNAGITGSFMFYHPEMDAYFIGCLNQFEYHRKGVMLMFKMINILSKYDAK